MSVSEFDQAIVLKKNALLKHHPELYNEWNFVKNNENELNIYKVTRRNGKYAWWTCLKCKSDYESIIANKAKGVGCPYCAGKKANHTNSLACINSKLSLEWHPTKNGDLTPHHVTISSNKKVWWICDQKHEWETSIDKRANRKQKCPYCTNVKVLVGYNDMWTTNPELASLLLNAEDGFRYTRGSEKKVDWKCLECGEIVKNKMIYDTYRVGLCCPSCSDGKSYPEKLFYHLLNSLNVDFEWEKKFVWLPDRRYDFYLPEQNMIIEMHGEQHYKKGFEYLGGKSLLEQQLNDNYKKEKAQENNIERYIVVDASISQIDFLKKNIIESEFGSIFDLSAIEWEDLDRKALKSLVVTVCELWSIGKNVKEIVLEINMSNTTVRNYLNRGRKIGISNYNGNKKRIVQLSLSNELIKEWDSIIEASNSYGDTSICACCNGHRESSSGFKWMHKEAYEDFLKKLNK